jgi:hypothetical protein
MRQFYKIPHVLLCFVFSISPLVMLRKCHNDLVKVCYRKPNLFVLNFLFLFQVFSHTHDTLLPIKPKPLLYPKDSTILTNSRHGSKADQIGCNIILVRFFFVSIISYVSFLDKIKTYFLSMR